MEQGQFFSRLNKPVIGMIHLRPLPGSAAYVDGGSGPALEQALADGRLLDAAGVDAILMQNTGDLPASSDGGPETIAYMTAIGTLLRQELKTPLGVNILANGTESALAVAAAIGAAFVRIKVYVGAVVSIGGIIQGSAQRARDFVSRVDARTIEIAADVYDRTSRPLGDMPIEDVAHYASFHGAANALVVTGASVDESIDRLRRVKATVKSVPLYAGGGTTKDNIHQFMAVCDGVIVGNAVKTGQEFQGCVDRDRLMAYMDAVHKARG
jgi:membrane complex biogenesis BtpA family protein